MTKIQITIYQGSLITVNLFIVELIIGIYHAFDLTTHKAWFVICFL